MIYVFDSGPFIDLFRHYYPQRFPTLWDSFNAMIRKGTLVSVREVKNELEGHNDNLSEWVKENKHVFSIPDEQELLFVREIFNVPHFQGVIRRKELLVGKPVADPFVIAKAKAVNGFVVTNERRTPNAAKMPNICEHFKIGCTNLEGFMESERWTF